MKNNYVIFILGFVICIIIEFIYKLIRKKCTIDKIKSYFSEKIERYSSKFEDQLILHPNLKRKSTWLFIGIVTGSIFTFLIIFLIYKRENREYLINLLSACGTIAAVWTSIYFNHKDNKKSIEVEAICTYKGGTADNRELISIQTYAVNTSKYAVRLELDGVSMYDGALKIAVGALTYATNTPEVIKAGESTEIYEISKKEILEALNEFEHMRKEPDRFYKKEILNKLNPNQFQIEVEFLEGEKTSYFGYDEVDLSEAPFWKEIKEQLK
ncbi:hypothetical protein PT287_03180 [Lactobacillus sp. ESL0679]|uniref:hypothetical protein n=1 Tax=Lactobacillus sp. ESL0679 TaxID=2983209 RepID=UPI0023F6C743|nr:hypothetical protein [Lactobacillus sp. ESL0679]MDF7682524.1 hypothetical protein [Lactobacillus sp. ESL0679]